MPERESVYPLTSWTLGGFRAIKEKTVFDLGGLNILVGENSAGKSSVLQSLLLTAQTLATPMADRPLVLNGPLVRLGLADDCVHEEAEREMTLGFGLAPNPSDFDKPTMSELIQIDVGADFMIATEDETAFHLASTRIAASTLDEGTLHLNISERGKEEARAAMKKHGADDETAERYAEAVGFGATGDLPDRTIGVYATQFLPESLVVLRNAYLRELRTLAGYWRPRIGVRMRPSARKREGVISPPVTAMIRRYFSDANPPISEKIPPEGGWRLEELSELPAQALEELALLPRSPWFTEHVEDLPFNAEVEIESIGGELENGIDFARRWFAKNVRHLGPLRAAPQPLYGLPEAASGASVGPNGEYTAAVLSAYGGRLSSMPLPDGSVRKMKLSTAVDHWMAELGLLAAVKSLEQGKLGYELQVSVDGVSRPLDLTTVGVGVSQALPIVVLGLIAEPHSLLLFEQPELHLHPDVQAALGDFFLALARSGRQLVIETHSEYLINRLRRRQVENPNSGPAELVRLFFFERNGSAAKVTAARIGSDGSMPEWPRGFLDTAARELKAIVMASET